MALPKPRKTQAPSQCVEPAAQTSTSSYVDVSGSKIDTGANGEKAIAFQLSEAGGVNGVTFQIVASVDDSHYTAIKGADATGTDNGSTDIAVAASGTTTAIVSPTAASGARSSFRFYKVQVKDTSGGSHGSALVVGHAK